MGGCACMLLHQYRKIWSVAKDALVQTRPTVFGLGYAPYERPNENTLIENMRRILRICREILYGMYEGLEATLPISAMPCLLDGLQSYVIWKAAHRVLEACVHIVRSHRAFRSFQIRTGDVFGSCRTPSSFPSSWLTRSDRVAMVCASLRRKQYYIYIP